MSYDSGWARLWENLGLVPRLAREFLMLKTTFVAEMAHTRPEEELWRILMSCRIGIT